MILNRMVLVVFCCAVVTNLNAVNAQETCVTYKLVPQTTYKTHPLTLTTLVNETVMQPKQVTTYKPVWTSETRQRRTTVLKPIVKTSEREERYLVKRPIVETSYREDQIEETSYETVTEMREQRYLVESPVVETRMREEKVLVRKPVTTTMFQTENVTTYKPVTVSETQYVPSANVRNDLMLESSGRNRLRWLTNGGYMNPNTGKVGYRKRGLHWVPEQTVAICSTLEPTLIPQQVSRTVYTPETVQVQKLIEVTSYVDQYETRKVPVQVSTMSKKIHVVKVPVTVQKPVTKIRIKKTPIQEVKYREEIYVRRVPVTETTYQRVEKVEPYQVNVCKWVAETREIQVPTTVTKRVDHTVNRVVPETSWMQVPVDSFGNVIAIPDSVISQIRPTSDLQIARRISETPIIESYRETANNTVGESTSSIGELIVVRKLGENEYRDSVTNAKEITQKPKSVLIPESGTNVSKPETETVIVKRPSNPNEADTQPVLDSSDDGTIEPTPVDPSIIDESNDKTNLEIDSSGDAEINVRPESDSENDPVSLNGSN